MTDYMYQKRREEYNLPAWNDNVDASIQRFEDYREKHEGGLITAPGNTKTNRMTIIRKQKCEEKQLYGRFKRLISNI